VFCTWLGSTARSIMVEFCTSWTFWPRDMVTVPVWISLAKVSDSLFSEASL
jgi:hypothetical protein